MLMFWLLAGVLYLLEINKYLNVPSFIYYILILFPIVFFVVGGCVSRTVCLANR